VTLAAAVDLRGINAQLEAVTAAARSAVRKAAQAGAQVYHDEVRARVPVSAKPHKSGKKTYTPGTLRRAVYQAFVEDESGQGRATYRISWNKSHAFYGRFVEFGTAKMAAKPFLRPAFDAAQPRAISAVNAVLAAELKKAKR
jgi:HK97 gp10 family phage protein